MKTNLDTLLQEYKQAKIVTADIEQKLVILAESQAKEIAQLLKSNEELKAELEKYKAKTSLPELKKSRVSEILSGANKKQDNELQVFSNDNLGNVRIINQNNEALFCLADIAKILELQNSRQVASSIDREFDKGGIFYIHPLDTAGGKQNFTFITEPELYFVLMRSNSQKAKPFRLWLTKEVLPSIRKTGTYQANEQTQQEIFGFLKAKGFIKETPKEASDKQNIGNVTGITITSLEIAELTGKRHDNVMHDVETQLREVLGGDGGLLKFKETYIHPQNKQSYKCYRLPKREALIVVSGYNAKLRAMIIDRLEYLENQVMSRILNNQQENKNTINESLKQYEALFNMKFSADTPAKEFILKSVQEAELRNNAKVDSITSYKYTEELKKGKIFQNSEIGLLYDSPVVTHKKPIITLGKVNSNEKTTYIPNELANKIENTASAEAKPKIRRQK